MQERGRIEWNGDDLILTMDSGERTIVPYDGEIDHIKHDTEALWIAEFEGIESVGSNDGVVWVQAVAATPPERKHTPLPELYSRAHLVFATGSASSVATCCTNEAAEFIALACNSHYGLVEALKGVQKACGTTSAPHIPNPAWMEAVDVALGSANPRYQNTAAAITDAE